MARESTVWCGGANGAPVGGKSGGKSGGKQRRRRLQCNVHSIIQHIKGPAAASGSRLRASRTWQE